ncbi:hypothetical protein CUMW_020230 [Citrus unshiu]|nr:hypothetical protein CUMW_020230 [Citrus unshiu]
MEASSYLLFCFNIIFNLHGYAHRFVFAATSDLKNYEGLYFSKMDKAKSSNTVWELQESLYPSRSAPTMIYVPATVNLWKR